MVLSQQEIEKAHDAFEKFDVDHSGCIDAWELKEAMKSLGQVESSTRLMILNPDCGSADIGAYWHSNSVS
jgi:Ca2+-binding EF-hand superfamily protein